MRYAVAFIPGMPVRRVVELAQRAEELGFDTLFIPDQTFHRDPFVVLGLCAQATTRIQLGLAVTNPYTRHPLQLARAAGVLGEVAGGRFVLGLGAGNRNRVLHGFGLSQTGSVGRLREAVDVIRRLLAGETLDYESETLVLRDVALDYVPPHPVPIYIGTRGPRTLRLAGEIADGVLMEGLCTPGGLAWALGQVAEGAALAERSPSDLATIAWQAIEIVDRSEQIEEPRFRSWAALLIMTTAADVLREIGVSEEAMAAVAAETARGVAEPTGEAIPPEDIRKLLMVGTTDEIRARFADVGAAGGIDCISGIVLGDEDEVAATIERLANVVKASRAA